MKFSADTRFRVIVDNVCFRATVEQILDGVGDFVSVNDAVRQSLYSLEKFRDGDGVEQFATGHAGMWGGRSVQLTLI